VVVCGEFNRGKSTLVNALLRTDICPVDVLPTTAVPAVIEYGDEAAGVIEFADGRQEAFTPTAEVLRRLSIGSGNPISSVRLVRMTLPSALLREGMVLVDTPGVNDLSLQSGEVTYGFLPLADAAVVVLDATAPVTKSEARFLSDQVLPNMVKRLVFVLGKCDRLEEDEVPDAVEEARRRLCSVVGSRPPVLPVSALRAIRGDESHIQQLMVALRGLTSTTWEEREQVAAGRLRRAADELLREVEARECAVSVDPEATTAMVAVSQTADEARARYETFAAYIDQYGRRTLRELVSASLTRLRDDIEMDLLHRLDLLSGNIREFVERQAPYDLSLAVRRWAEHKGREIETFLEKLTHRIAADYATAFAAPLETAALPRLLLNTEFSQRQAESQTSKVEEVIRNQLLPSAVPMAAGYLLLGPLGLLVGSVCGQAFSYKIREDEIRRQKKGARDLITREVTLALEQFGTSVNHEIDRWFDGLDALLRKGIDERVAYAERVARPRTDKDVAQLESIRTSIRNALGTLVPTCIS
jgi:hypothetical protein